MMTHHRSVLWLGGVIFGLLAIAPGSMRDAAAAVPGPDKGFPPPRSISDITAILDLHRNDEPKDAARWRRILELEAPTDATDAGRARFHMRRGIAAHGLSQSRRAIAELKRAESLGDTLSTKERSQILQFIASTESSMGNRLRAIDYLRRAIKVSRNIVFKIRAARNLGNLLRTLGRPDAAEKVWSDAEALLAKLRDSDDAADKKAWRRWGRSLRARLLFARAGLLGRTGKIAAAEAMLRRVLADLEADDRRYRAASGPRDVTLLTRMTLGGIIAIRGRPVEGEAEIRAALLGMMRKHGRNHRHVGRILESLGVALLAEGRAEETEALMRASLDIMTRINAEPDSRRITRARWILAESLALQRRWHDALTEFELTERAFGSDRARFEAHYLQAPSFYTEALIKAGRVAEAVALARRSLRIQLKARGEHTGSTAVTRGLLAMALSAAGRDREALELFRQMDLVRIMYGNPLDPHRSRVARVRMLQFSAEAYLATLLRQRGTPLETDMNLDVVTEAFRLADLARNQSVQRALSSSAARSASGDPALVDLARRFQDANIKINMESQRYSELLSRPARDQDRALERSLAARIGRLRAQRDELGEEIVLRFPRYAALVKPRPATIASVRASLQKGEAMIATYVGEAETYVWAFSRSGPVHFSVVPLTRSRIAAVVDRLRRGVEPSDATLESIRPFDVDAAHWLYKALLAPAENGWKGARSLVVVAHGPLERLPLSVLVTENPGTKTASSVRFAFYRTVPWLARTHAVMTVPTAASFVTLRRFIRRTPGRRAFAGFADPWFNDAHPAADGDEGARGFRHRGTAASAHARLVLRSSPQLAGLARAGLENLPSLPETRREISSIAGIVGAEPERDLFFGPRANEERVKTMDLARYKVIAFASHALLPGELDGLAQPAIALSSPKISGTKGDGLLTLDEILRLKLDADWIVLSACNTAAGPNADAEAVSGLGRGFLYAGARALLVTHWRVESTSARILVTDLFRRQAGKSGLSRRQALRQAKLALIDGAGYRDEKGEELFSYAHPLFWAPFTLFGEGGRPPPD